MRKRPYWRRSAMGPSGRTCTCAWTARKWSVAKHALHCDPLGNLSRKSSQCGLRIVMSGGKVLGGGQDSSSASALTRRGAALVCRSGLISTNSQGMTPSISVNGGKRDCGDNHPPQRVSRKAWICYGAGAAEHIGHTGELSEGIRLSTTGPVLSSRSLCDLSGSRES
jgi:hypothetical protein